MPQLLPILTPKEKRLFKKADIDLPSLKIIVDTREPEPPHGFQPYFDLPVVRRVLETGDFALEGFDQLFTVERKTMDDYVGCCGISRDRWKRMLERILSYEHRALVIVADMEDLVTGNYVSRMNPNSVLASLIYQTLSYNVSLFTVPSEKVGARFTQKFLIAALVAHLSAEKHDKNAVLKPFAGKKPPSRKRGENAAIPERVGDNERDTSAEPELLTLFGS